MDVALPQARLGDPNEARLLVELGNCLRPAVTHTGPEPAYQLEYGLGQGALVVDPALYALWDEFELALNIVLEVPVLTAFFHCLYRAHAPVDLEGPPLVEHRLPRAFVRAGEKPPYHAGVRPGGKGLCYVPGVFYAAVGDDRDVFSPGRPPDILYRRDLRHPYPRHDPCGAD